MNSHPISTATQRALTLLAFLALNHASFAETPGRNFYVDPALGNESANGLAAKPTGSDGPVRTIARGLKFAQPGDTVHLAPARYKESAVFYNRKGDPEHPITLDGHGATLDGAEPLSPDQWKETSPGLFECSDLLHHDDAVIMRWFFLWDGKMNHMGRTSKGPRVALKAVADLQPGEWTYVKDPASVPGDKHGDKGTFYIKLSPGQKLADAHIAAPMRSAGVQFSGTNEWVVVRNVTSTHVYNDGFNIHGKCRDCLFENIRAIECGDDGISAHDDCQYRVDGFTSIGNSTGICDTGDSITDYRRVFIRDILGVDLFFLDTNRHSVADAVVISSASHALNVSGHADGAAICALRLENVLIRRVGSPNEVRIGKNSLLEASHVTFIDLGIHASAGELCLTDSVVAGAPAPEIVLGKDLKWRAARNDYDLKFFKVDTLTFAAADFPACQTATGQDQGSQWKTITIEPNGLSQTSAGRGASAKILQEIEAQ